jgi:hypothetical protein
MRLLSDMLVASGNEFYGNCQLAGSGKVKLYSALFVVAKGKTLFFCQRYPGN